MHYYHKVFVPNLFLSMFFQIDLYFSLYLFIQILRCILQTHKTISFNMISIIPVSK